MAKKDLFEIADTRSSAQNDAYKKLIEKLLTNGYKITSQATSKEEGGDLELLADVETTELAPPISDLPHIKFIAKQVYGYYDFNNDIFTKLDSPKFELKAFKKGAGLHNMNDPWDKFEI